MKQNTKKLAAACVAVLAATAMAIPGISLAAQGTAPSQITVGTLYAGSGAFATSSLSQYHGLKFWAKQVDADGGVEVAAYHKKIPIKIVAYNDQSSTSTAATLYTQLITRDKVNVLVADFGSVLTSVAVPIAQEHKTVLFDPTGTGGTLFSAGNKYMALLSLPTSSIWPTSLAQYLIEKKAVIKHVAIVFDANDFDASQAKTLKAKLGAAGIEPVYYHSVPTSTRNYSSLIRVLQSHHPDAVIEFGYDANDIAFLKGLKSSGTHFNMVFTVFPGQELSLLEKNVGVSGLQYTYTYPTPPLVKFEKVNYGMNTAQFEKAFKAATSSAPNFLNVAGYNAGLIIQATLEHAKGLTQDDLRSAVAALSGKLDTLNGQFKINDEGAQVGELLPVAQFTPSGDSLKINVVYPRALATSKAVYPAPAH